MNGLPVFNPRKPDNEKSGQREIVPLNALKLLCAFMELEFTYLLYVMLI